MRNKFLLSLLTSSLVILFSCKKSEITHVSEESYQLVSKTEIDNFIKDQIYAHHYFEWNMASDEMIWSAVQQSDNMLSVGYTIDGFADFNNRIADIDINESSWQKVRASIIDLVLQSERKINEKITLAVLEPWRENVLPVLDLYVRNPETFRLLKSLKIVRYAEPMGYEPEQAYFDFQKENQPDHAITSSSGCGTNIGFIGLVDNVDFTTIAPGTKQSWNHPYHNISRAWTKSTGAGTKVFFIDTGCSSAQENLGSAFNQGYSGGRTIEKIVTLPQATLLGIPTGPVETPNDGCGHGTSMAGACGAPRGTDGNACGIAYNCNLVTCRAAADVYLDESREVKGVADAFTNAGKRTDVKIISMSMGRITGSTQISDAVRYAYGKGKLIFCAAGTSFSWTSGWVGVIFPAWMTEVNAVTGVRTDNFSSSCTECHDGSETDFTIVMERLSDARRPLTLAMSGDVPSLVGGSSVATASAAGIAALVYSKYPTYTRDQILNKLIQTSANYPTRSTRLGWGNLNADAATN